MSKANKILVVVTQECGVSLCFVALHTKSNRVNSGVKLLSLIL